MGRKPKELPIEEICEYYQENLVSIKEAAKHFKTSPLKVSSILKVMNIHIHRNRYGYVFFHLLNREKVRNWGAQTKIAKELYKECPDMKFWIQLKPPSSLIYSLRYFQTEYGKRFIKNKYNDFKFKKIDFMEEINLENEKVDDDVFVEIKPKTIHDFLNIK